jgi:hypothetical protein
LKYCRICFWPPQKLKKPIFINPHAEPKNSMATKHTGAYPKPKSFSGKLHQTLSYRAQGRAFPLVSKLYKGEPLADQPRYPR